MSSGSLGGDDPEIDEVDENAEAASAPDQPAPASDHSAAWASVAPPDRGLGAAPE